MAPDVTSDGSPRHYDMLSAPPKHLARLPAVAAVVVVSAATTVGCGVPDGIERQIGGTPESKSCVVADVSGSTKGARPQYIQFFRTFAQYAGEKQSGKLCLILAAGDPFSAGHFRWGDVGPTNRGNSGLAPGEVRQAVDTTANQLDAVLRDPPVRGRGSAIVESAAVASEVLSRGDRLQMLSDAIQASFIDLHDVDLSASGIQKLLDEFDRRRLLRPLDGVIVEFPQPLSRPEGTSMSAEQLAGVEAFWRAWAKRTGADLVWRSR